MVIFFIIIIFLPLSGARKIIKTRTKQRNVNIFSISGINRRSLAAEFNVKESVSVVGLKVYWLQKGEYSFALRDEIWL